MKIPAIAVNFGLYASVTIGLALWYSTTYEVSEEERIAELVAKNPKQLSGAKRKEYEDKMQNFFRNMKNNDNQQGKTFDDILKKGVKKEEKRV